MFPKILVSATALAFALSLAVASPAAASPIRTPPPGDTLYGISCDFGNNDQKLHVLAFDGSTAEAESHGSMGPTEPYFCALGVSWDRTVGTCTVYTLARGADEPPALLRTNLATGQSSFVAPVTLDGVSEFGTSIAIDGNGDAWAIRGDGFYSLNLATGVLTLVAPLNPVTSELGGLTWSPHDGLLYAHDRTQVYVVSLTGAVTLTGSVDLTTDDQPTSISGMTIDSSGGFWFAQVENRYYEGPAEWIYELWSTDRTLASLERAGETTTGGANVGVAALLALPPTAACGDVQLPTLPLPVTPDPAPAALAATGRDTPVAVIGLASVVLGVGAAMILLASRRTRRR